MFFYSNTWIKEHFKNVPTLDYFLIKSSFRLLFFAIFFKILLKNKRNFVLAANHGRILIFFHHFALFFINGIWCNISSYHRKRIDIAVMADYCSRI